MLDDEPMIVDALARTLRDDGATVTAACSSAEATGERAGAGSPALPRREMRPDRPSNMR